MTHISDLFSVQFSHFFIKCQLERFKRWTGLGWDGEEERTAETSFHAFYLNRCRIGGFFSVDSDTCRCGYFIFIQLRATVRSPIFCSHFRQEEGKGAGLFNIEAV